MPDNAWRIYNFVTGAWEAPPAAPPERISPSEYWLEGWNTCMDGHPEGVTGNPYPEGSYEAREWQDGYDAAMRD